MKKIYVYNLENNIILQKKLKKKPYTWIIGGMVDSLCENITAYFKLFVTL